MGQKKKSVDLNSIKTIDQLKTLGFMDLKKMCKLKKLPTNGTKAQLFMKLKAMFSKELEMKKEDQNEIKVVISKSAENEKKNQLNAPKKKSPSPQTPQSVKINEEIENKEEIDYDSSSSAYTSSEDGGHAEKTDKKFVDFYCGMSGHKETVPPNFGWDTIEPNGIWPAPGLTVHDIDISKQNLKPPVIEKVIPQPFGAKVYFVCEEPRVPLVCQHMEHHFEIQIVGSDNEQTIIKTKQSPAVFTNLINGNEYQFIVKLISDISVRFSEKSDIVIPLLLPNKPQFINIETKPKEIFLYWDCKEYDIKDVKAQITLTINPIIPTPDGYECNENGDIILQSNCIHLKGLMTGTEYEVQLKATNTVGCMESEIENVSPTYPPPQPSIKQVISGNREIIIDLKCDGWNNKETKCWFEVDANPIQPDLDWLQNEIY